MKYDHFKGLFLVLFIIAAMLAPSAFAQADGGTTKLDNGAFYTQTSKQIGYGYAITDEGTDDRGQMVRFWTEFQHLGGVDTLGYPVSQRFMWDGFICQATQRVIMQWRPESRTVSFVNVFDLASTAGKDDYLEAVRQVPKPAQYNDAGKPFQQVLNERLALLDARPALRSAYVQAGSNAVDVNGLPVAPITDMGDAYVLRAQRVVFQEWKKDMPWAKAGQVTVALGGDIAKELGLIQAQSATAISPEPPPQVSAVTPAQVASDPAIQAAAQILIDYDRQHQTKYMATLVRNGAHVSFAPLPDGVLGDWTPRTGTLVLSTQLAKMGTPAIAAVLAHESSHAYSSYTGVKIISSKDCYEDELRAFVHQADVWGWMYPGGKPDPKNQVETEMNYLLTALQNNPDQWMNQFLQLYRQECGL